MGQIIAESFNKYFVSVAQNPISYISRAFNQLFSTISLKCVSSEEIEDIKKSLKIKQLHGYDAMSTKILKLGIHYSSCPLTYICNRFLSSGIFPTRLKFSDSNLYIKEEIKMIHLIIDLFLCQNLINCDIKLVSYSSNISIN